MAKFVKYSLLFQCLCKITEILFTLYTRKTQNCPKQLVKETCSCASTPDGHRQTLTEKTW